MVSLQKLKWGVTAAFHAYTSQIWTFFLKLQKLQWLRFWTFVFLFRLQKCSCCSLRFWTIFSHSEMNHLFSQLLLSLPEILLTGFQKCTLRFLNYCFPFRTAILQFKDRQLWLWTYFVTSQMWRMQLWFHNAIVISVHFRNAIAVFLNLFCQLGNAVCHFWLPYLDFCFQFRNGNDAFLNCYMDFLNSWLMRFQTGKLLKHNDDHWFKMVKLFHL